MNNKHGIARRILVQQTYNPGVPTDSELEMRQTSDMVDGDAARTNLPRQQFPYMKDN